MISKEEILKLLGVSGYVIYDDLCSRYSEDSQEVLDMALEALTASGAVKRAKCQDAKEKIQVIYYIPA